MRLNHKTGAAGEDAALAFLQAQGCKLVARNWHCAFGEIDLIVKQGKILLFVEVKYRKNGAYGGAVASITQAKLAKLTRSVEHYLQTQTTGNMPCRLDAVLIEGDMAPVWIQNITG
ncbi:MAG: YraN family protein [Neisseria sp.]|uniref:YraN family protein n=1 Tax=Neisseria sp. TaxID=192066 RepID=UPI0026DD3920|nr:YraN family protein [Neisseria sp.]MDO4642085.1 YraN family protein [Neisseria sp.]